MRRVNQRVAWMALFCAVTVLVFWKPRVFSHETLTTTVLFDREIVRTLDKHCVMCHFENGPSLPLETYEQTWLQGRRIRADIIARHMPPWAALPGYGQFVNENNLTLRETQFVVSWVEGLGPRNAGTVFSNIADSSAPARTDVRAQAHFGHWMIGEPNLTRPLDANTVEAHQAGSVKRVVIDSGLNGERRLRALEYMPGDRRVVRAVFFKVQETGQWIGSWTPWYGVAQLPAGVSYRLPAGAHIVAEIHYRGANESVVDRGTLGLYFADQPGFNMAPDLTLEMKPQSGAAPQKIQAVTRLTADTYALSLLPEIAPGMTSIEVSARKPDGSREILLFAKDLPTDWPTPYVLANPVLLPKGTDLIATAYTTAALPPIGSVRLTVSSYRR
jgi:hypothetical protein